VGQAARRSNPIGVRHDVGGDSRRGNAPVRRNGAPDRRARPTPRTAPCRARSGAARNPPAPPRGAPAAPSRSARAARAPAASAARLPGPYGPGPDNRRSHGYGAPGRGRDRPRGTPWRP
jgi:hypothetical protein